MQGIENPVQHCLAIPGWIVVDHAHNCPGRVGIIPGVTGNGAYVLEVTGLDASFSVQAGIPQPPGHGSVHCDERH